MRRKRVGWMTPKLGAADYDRLVRTCESPPPASDRLKAFVRQAAGLASKKILQ